MILWKPDCRSLKQKQKNQPITKLGNLDCDWFILPLLLPTSTIWFSIDHQRKKCKRSDSSDSDSVELTTPLTTTPIFNFHQVISALTTPLTTPTPTPTPSPVKTSLYGMTNNGFEMLEKARFFFWCTCQFCVLLHGRSIWVSGYCRHWKTWRRR